MEIMEEKESGAAGIPEVCHACVIDQALSAARFAALDGAQTERVVAVADLSRVEKGSQVLIQGE